MEKWALPPSLVLCHYLDDIMLTCEDLLSLFQAAASLQGHSKTREWEVNADKVQGPGQSIKFLGVMWSGKTKVMPEAVIDKIQ